MKQLKLIIAAVILCIAIPATAQNYSRVQVGYNATFLDVKGGDGETLNGFTAQYTYGIGFQEAMAVEIGGQLGYGSCKIADETFKLFTIAIPVNYAYKFNLSDNFALAPYAGLNFKVHAMGKYAGQDIFKKETLDANRFQMGWQVGVAAHFSKFYVAAQYGTDFIKLAEGLNTSALGVSVGYTF